MESIDRQCITKAGTCCPGQTLCSEILVDPSSSRKRPVDAMLALLREAIYRDHLEESAGTHTDELVYLGGHGDELRME